ncbi:MAG: hypothetical protein KDA81_22185, partial [Planctomycetaceae bacterium]|nr:hypothetical protein [Planctomycetaceae bacterium]
LTITRSNGRADWTATVKHDVSIVAKGKKSAVVTAASSRDGNGRADIVVGMVTGSFDSLAEGVYETTLIGTISGF